MSRELAPALSAVKWACLVSLVRLHSRSSLLLSTHLSRACQGVWGPLAKRDPFLSLTDWSGAPTQDRFVAVSLPFSVIEFREVVVSLTKLPLLSFE